ncbi:hypothetical protein BKH46_07125 [Helicobacter sp. 12S02634-8]|uniref:DEAD/DEAH box helicase family protein n=1 Tax=Helicobacter sp. 12S02634-8 TaxID=1476199 RepID=UPI000BC7A20A|nr:DEAD/DEAH box helicase family protein [Helicobacter sp. 12S02634-8]PAF46507.1 hypothetical protein BKH46_07125 [Helicobacter sp. 12S02634-8]
MKLYEEIKNVLVMRPNERCEIPEYILENLNLHIELRPYQKEALQYYLFSRKNPELQMHLMFEMATGSGKTLMMAALMLECFKRGYENFVFFVHSSAILEKTKQNFSNPQSSKYLFAPDIVIDAQNIAINVCKNFNESKAGQINIYFDTIQGLFSLLNRERENAFTIADFKGKKLVVIADEAHHLNAQTKKKQSQKDQQDMQSWEGVSQEIFKAHSENMLFEFSATLPREKSVQEKYEDKIIYEYTLKDFRHEGYSKEINLIKYEGAQREKRILGALVCSLYRQEIAGLHKIALKPVVLFKSRTIKESNENQELFFKMLDELDVGELEKFFGGVLEGFGVLYEAKKFFQQRSLEQVLRDLKREFQAHFIININDTTELETNQILINTLEDGGNKIRAIFAVDKLNEGWDVLNLFDIVRLTEGAINDTPKEAQLIGRGARYFPFEAGGEYRGIGERYKRKFDTLSVPLRALEILCYHAEGENAVIHRLRAELKQMGLIDDDREYIELKLKEEFKASKIYREGYFAANKVSTIKNAIKNAHSENPCVGGYFDLKALKEAIDIFKSPLQVRLVNSSYIQEIKVLDEDMEQKEELEGLDDRQNRDFKELCGSVILKAMDKSGEFFTFENLKQVFDGIKGRGEFIEKYFAPIKLELDKRQTHISPQTRLEIALFVCEAFKNQIQAKIQTLSIQDWYLIPLKFLGDKVITRAKKQNTQDGKNGKNSKEEQGSAIDVTKFQWFAFKNFVGTSEEMRFVEVISGYATKLDEKYTQWFLIRNERNPEMAVYVDESDKNSSDPLKRNDIRRFEPDFYFLGCPKDDDGIEILQCLIEPKGKGFVEKDEWKEKFLKRLLSTPVIVENNEKKFKFSRVKVIGLPFFTESDTNKFNEALEESLLSQAKS